MLALASLGVEMFGTGSNKTNDDQDAGPVNDPAVKQPNPPATITPNPTVAPTAPLIEDSAAPYLEANKPGLASVSSEGSDSFLETGSGDPKIGTGTNPMLATGSVSSTTPAVPGDLIKLKQQALQSLAPLVDHLEQTPEERFKTLMMMIQASDDSHYIKEAYAAANEITDEKVRAQALLDVVNEINYFAQNQGATSDAPKN